MNHDTIRLWHTKEDCDSRCDVISCQLRPLAVQEQETVYVEMDVFEKELAELQVNNQHHHGTLNLPETETCSPVLSACS